MKKKSKIFGRGESHTRQCLKWQTKTKADLRITAEACKDLHNKSHEKKQYKEYR